MPRALGASRASYLRSALTPAPLLQRTRASSAAFAAVINHREPILPREASRLPRRRRWRPRGYRGLPAQSPGPRVRPVRCAARAGGRLVPGAWPPARDRAIHEPVDSRRRHPVVAVERATSVARRSCAGTAPARSGRIGSNACRATDEEKDARLCSSRAGRAGRPLRGETSSQSAPGVRASSSASTAARP